MTLCTCKPLVLRSSLPRQRQRGMTLISVLAAMLIFAFGILSLAGLYGRLMSAQTGNETATSTQTFGNRFWALLEAYPGLVNELGSASVSYDASTIATAPAALQPLLNDIFTSPYVSLPGSSVTITRGNDALGQPCMAPAPPAATLCGVALRIDWASPGGGAARSQNYSFQVGSI